MISNTYNFNEFLTSIKDLDWYEIIEISNKEVQQVESSLYGVKGAVRRRENGGPEYVAQIKKILFFLQSGSKPSSDNYFPYYKDICLNLIKKGQLNKSILSLFE